MTQGELTCQDCQRRIAPAAGYLRPEGFVCKECYDKRLEDPEYVARLERELLGLVRTASEPESTAPGLVVPARLEAPARLALDSLTGLAVADALGAAREGQPYQPAARPLVLPAADSPAAWTDDTQMAISVVEGLLEKGEISPETLARAFARRYESWRGYGSGMHTVMTRIRGGEDWRDVRYAVFRDGSYGNGSAMRVPPLGAYLAHRPVDDVVEQATRSAVVTHPHPEGVAGAVATAVAAWHAARSRGGSAPDTARLLGALAAACPGESEVAVGLRAALELTGGTDLGHAVRRLGNGSRVSCPDTVPLAVWIASHHLDDYPAAVETAVAAGGDTDTVAAIAGGIVAARVGIEGIPASWLEVTEPLPLDYAARPGP